MRIYSTSSDPPPVKAALLDVEQDKPEKKKIKYPYHDEMHKLFTSTWSTLFLLFITFIDNGQDYYGDDKLLSPCNYTNMLSIKETLLIQHQFNQTQHDIYSYKSHLSFFSNNTEEDKNKYNSLLQTATEKSATLNGTYNYHKTQWKKCFNQNYISFKFKIFLLIAFLAFLGLSATGHQIYKIFKLKSKIEATDLTEEEKEVYEKEQKRWGEIRMTLISSFMMLAYYCLTLILNICLAFFTEPRYQKIMPYLY